MHPAWLSHCTRILPHPAPQRSGTWLPTVAHPALALPEAPAPGRSTVHGNAGLPQRLPRCPLVLAAAQAPGARQPTTLQQGEGRRCSQAPETGQLDALQGVQKAPCTPSPKLPSQGPTGAPRSRAEPPQCHCSLPNLYHQAQTATVISLHPDRSTLSYTRSCHKRFYIPFGTALTCVPTADAILGPKSQASGAAGNPPAVQWLLPCLQKWPDGGQGHWESHYISTTQCRPGPGSSWKPSFSLYVLYAEDK